MTDTNQKTLYVYPVEDPSSDYPCELVKEGVCDNSIWDPLRDDKDEENSPDYAHTILSDGTEQWNYRGMGLFRRTTDINPDDTSSEGVDNAYVAQPIDLSKFNTPTEGVVLTNSEWSTLYVIDNETTDNLLCDASCLKNWPPLRTYDTITDRSDFSVFTNAEGFTQWAYKNKPLYFFKDDAKPGDVTGQGLPHASGGTWVVAKP